MVGRLMHRRFGVPAEDFPWKDPPLREMNSAFREFLKPREPFSNQKHGLDRNDLATITQRDRSLQSTFVSIKPNLMMPMSSPPAK